MPEHAVGMGPIDQVRVYVVHHPHYAEGCPNCNSDCGPSGGTLGGARNQFDRDAGAV